jgi:hypothetical protein
MQYHDGSTAVAVEVVPPISMARDDHLAIGSMINTDWSV